MNLWPSRAYFVTKNLKMKDKVEISIYSEPPKKISDKIKRIMKKAEKKLGKNPSLLCPPHITMRSGLIIPISKKEYVFSALKEIIRKNKKIKVKVKGISQYKGKKVSCIQLEVLNKGEIKKIHNKLEVLFPEYTRGYIIKKFNPHISLFWNKNSKIKKRNFLEAFNSLNEKYKNFAFQYPLDKLTVYKKVGDKFTKIKELK